MDRIEYLWNVNPLLVVIVICISALLCSENGNVRVIALLGLILSIILLIG